MSKQQQEQFLRTWCNDHPLATYGDGAVLLLKTLPTLEEHRR
jgi:hypothetical protein